MIGLEPQPTCIINEHARDDNPNMQSSSNKKSEKQTTSSDQNQLSQCPDIQYIIIDMAPVTFIDSSGSKILERVSMYMYITHLYLSFKCDN